MHYLFDKLTPTGAPCYLTKFRDSCRHNSFTYAADGRCPERPASATTTHKSRFVITTSLAGRLFGMQFLLLSRAASTRRISELPCRLSGTKNHHFAKLRFHDFQRSKLADLTSRELEVATLLAEGQSNKQIAKELEISQETVKVHVKHVLNKLKLNSRVKVALYMVQQK